jgi:hypothetical protein
MSTTWYNTPERIAALDHAATQWLGTPFRANSAISGAGGGVSCHHLFAELHFSTGCLARIVVPAGDPRTLVNGQPDDFLNRFDAAVGSRFVPVTDETMAGDLLFIRYGATIHHLVNVISGGRCVHVLRNTGTLITPLAALLSSHHNRVSIAALRRPIA